MKEIDLAMDGEYETFTWSFVESLPPGKIKDNFIIICDAQKCMMTLKHLRKLIPIDNFKEKFDYHVKRHNEAYYAIKKLDKVK